MHRCSCERSRQERLPFFLSFTSSLWYNRIRKSYYSNQKKELVAWRFGIMVIPVFN